MPNYDFRHTASTYQWYVQDNRPKRVLYGPYSSKEDAQAAQILTLDWAKIEPAQAKGLRWQRDLDAYQGGPVRYAVGSVSAADLEALQADPQSNGYQSVTVKPPRALKIHPSWKARPYGVDPLDTAMYFVTGESRFLGF